MNRVFLLDTLHRLFIVTISALWKFLLLSLICPYPTLPGHHVSVTNKGRLHQEGNGLKGLEKRIFAPPGALLTPSHTALAYTKALCALTPKHQLLLEMGNLLWLMVAVSI